MYEFRVAIKRDMRKVCPFYTSRINPNNDSIPEEVRRQRRSVPWSSASSAIMIREPPAPLDMETIRRTIDENCSAELDTQSPAHPPHHPGSLPNCPESPPHHPESPPNCPESPRYSPGPLMDSEPTDDNNRSSSLLLDKLSVHLATPAKETDSAP